MSFDTVYVILLARPYSVGWPGPDFLDYSLDSTVYSIVCDFAPFYFDRQWDSSGLSTPIVSVLPVTPTSVVATFMSYFE